MRIRGRRLPNLGTRVSGVASLKSTVPLTRGAGIQVCGWPLAVLRFSHLKLSSFIGMLLRTVLFY
jgi:hypothetical protein